MSTTCSDSDKCSISDDDSEFNYIPGYWNIEAEDHAGESDSKGASDDENGYEPYSNEPLADEEWIEDYRKRQLDKEKRLKSLNDRLAGKENLSNWCSCGNCSISFLQNANECYCCQDMEKCIEALSDEWVIEEMQAPPSCITLHPAFKTVCLDRWSLRLSARKYRTIDRSSYRQTGSEEANVIAFYNFIHLVYDRVGKNRIPLPACAYYAIGSKFEPKDNEGFVGFIDEEEEMSE